MSLKDLSYVRHEYPALQRAIFRMLDRVSGQARFLQTYGDHFDPWLDAMRRRGTMGLIAWASNAAS